MSKSIYQYLFGPVPSRRLGMSLGVDLVPHKVCTMNCVYCECGKTTELTLNRSEYVPTEAVIEELRDYLNRNPFPETITFSGRGEPTLHVKIGEVLRFLKRHYPSLPVTLLSNGSLFYRKDVRAEIRNADRVIPSLDAATNVGFRKINRPFHSLTLGRYIYGLARFRKEYHGQYWLEVFVVPGLNDREEELANLKRAIAMIQPDRVQLNTLDRPGTVASLRPASFEVLTQIRDYFQMDNVEIISPRMVSREKRTYRSDVEQAILETISRRPCTREDLAEILGRSVTEISRYLKMLESTHKLVTIHQKRGCFYQIVK